MISSRQLLQFRCKHSGLHRRKFLVVCPPISCVDRCSVSHRLVLDCLGDGLSNGITDPFGDFADTVVSR